MATINRTANAVWNGNLKSGDGRIDTTSGILKQTPYSFTTRFEDSPGTNPEELLAASHAACYSMAFALTLSNKGYQPASIDTRPVCTLESQADGSFKITKIHLETKGQVPDMNAETFQQIAQEAEAVCVISNALRQGVEIELDASLA
ncbi:OsmC family protein [Myxosarcina sp. GI1]|uniref:OsmC family protein n=1 Tax=Myxosarcina sp. GI1 TaxID=1541065 RepID=UPI000564350B|nr:OsmC family protein [Myxosarcina sp. GI1]